MNSRDALRRLKDGNRRFVSGTPRTSWPRKPELADKQDPFAVVIGCSDSRVPVEAVFDQGPGDLFVVRVAGHALLPALRGSVEIAVEHLDPVLVVVLGHTGCAAVNAALEPPTEEIGPASVLVEVIRRLIEGAPAEDAVQANVEGTVAALRAGLPDSILLTGAVYSVESRIVTFLDDQPN